MDEELRAELLARRDEDQRIRARVPPGPSAPDPDLLAEWRRIDESNTRWLTELTERVGWPTRSLVGDDGAHAAWLLAQHADPEHQPAFLALLRAAVQAGEASVSDLAYLEDRVRVRSGHLQLYGTQFTYDQGQLRPHPIEDHAHLDARRAAAGLGPFAEYEVQIRHRH